MAKIKEITVEQLCEMCKQQVKAGNGKKVVAISDDEEFNGFHPIYSGFVDKEDVFTGGPCEPLLSFGIKRDDDFIILG